MRLIILALLLVCAGLQAAESQPAVTLQEAPLRSEPSHTASSLEQVPANSPVSVLQRQGGWYRVSTSSGQQGWLPLLGLRFSKQANAKSNNLGQLLGAGSAAPASSVSTGVRGIGEEQLAGGGSALPSAVTSLRRFASSAADARGFAQQGGLKARSLPYAD